MIDIDEFQTHQRQLRPFARDDLAICSRRRARSAPVASANSMPGRFGGDESRHRARGSDDGRSRRHRRTHSRGRRTGDRPLTISVGIAPAQAATPDMRHWIDAAERRCTRRNAWAATALRRSRRAPARTSHHGSRPERCRRSGRIILLWLSSLAASHPWPASKRGYTITCEASGRVCRRRKRP